MEFLTIGLALYVVIHLATWITSRFSNNARWESLRTRVLALQKEIAVAESWVQKKPVDKEAEELLKFAQEMAKMLERGVEDRSEPLGMLLDLAMSPGIELAIAARFKAEHSKEKSAGSPARW